MKVKEKDWMRWVGDALSVVFLFALIFMMMLVAHVLESE